MPKQSVHKPAVPKDVVRRAGIIEANSTPLLRTTTEVQNPSQLAAVVSFRDDDIKWGRIEVRVGGREFCLINRKLPPHEDSFFIPL